MLKNLHVHVVWLVAMISYRNSCLFLSDTYNYICCGVDNLGGVNSIQYTINRPQGMTWVWLIVIYS